MNDKNSFPHFIDKTKRKRHHFLKGQQKQNRRQRFLLRFTRPFHIYASRLHLPIQTLDFHFFSKTDLDVQPDRREIVRVDQLHGAVALDVLHKRLEVLVQSTHKAFQRLFELLLFLTDAGSVIVHVRPAIYVTPFISHFSSLISAWRFAICLSFCSYSWISRSFTRISFNFSSIKCSSAYYSISFCSGSYMATIAIIAEFRVTHFCHKFRFIHVLTPFRSAFTRRIIRIWIISAMKHPALCVNESSHLFGFRFEFIRFAIDRLFLLDELSQLFFLLRNIRLKLFHLVLPRVEKQ